MKANYQNKILIILLFLVGITVDKLYAQEKEESPTILELKYFLPENKVPYLNVITKKKVGRKFEAVKAITVNVYLTEVSDSTLLGKVTTDGNGVARVGFPALVKPIWDALDEFTIVATSVPVAKEEILESEIIIKKAILVIDTTNEDGTRTVSAQLKEKKGDEWVAIPEIEMKLKIKRLLGNLTVGEEEIYTSDEAGIASAAFVKDSMPGDEKGNIVLLARVEDNDTYGNLSVEKIVPWGKEIQPLTHVWQRTLWSTGNKAPVWLLAIAFLIIIGIWGTILYLVRQMFKIKKLGKIFENNLTSAIPKNIT